MTLRDSDILDLPDAPDFISTPPQYTMEEMIKICEAMLPYWNARRIANPDPIVKTEAFILYDEIVK